MQVNQDDASISNIFRDFFTLISLVFLVLLVLIAIYASPIVEDDSEIESPGDLYVEIIWPPESKVDVDLWVQSADNPPVGYRNKSGLYLNLLRDDLGDVGDFSGYNSEITFSRGTAVGRHTVNVHIYRNPNPGLEKEIELKYIVKFQGEGEKSRSTVAIGYKKIAAIAGKEITLISFMIDKEGKVDSASKDMTTQRSLRNIRKTSTHVPTENTGSIP